MKKILLPILFFCCGQMAVAAGIAPVRVIGATTVDTMLAKGLLDKGVTFVDVRKAEDYKKGHIPGAVNLPVHGNFTSETLSSIVNKNERVLFYCNGVRCQASSIATKKALDWGWKSVFYYRDGFPVWKRSGLEVEK